MKTSCLIAALLTSIMAGAQTDTQTTLPPPTAYAAVATNADSRVMERTVYEQDEDGNVISNVQSYTEISSGMNYFQNGQWMKSRDRIEVLAQGGAAATNGQHQVFFPGDIGQGVIELVTPDGLQLNSRPMGLSYDDGANTVLIAVLTNSVGVLVTNNQVVYPNAFSGVTADLRYTYKKSGFEQDVVLQQQPPPPEAFGLNPQTTRLQVLTEYFNPPAPTQTVSPVSPQDGLTDTTLTFGRMEMVPGGVFTFGETNEPASRIPGATVYKSWVQLEGRTFLVEEVPIPGIATQLNQLPASGGVAMNSANGVLGKVSAKRLLPPSHSLQAGSGGVQLARADLKYQTGVVLDYVTLDSDEDNFTFQGDTTYYVDGEYYLSGTTIFEGGTVIKLGCEGQIDIGGTMQCQTASYHPAVLTSMNDNTVGSIIVGSSGTPANTDVNTFLTDYGQITNFYNMRFSYCQLAVYLNGGNLNFWNCQFQNIGCLVDGGYDPVGLYNVLFANLSNVSPIVQGEGNIIGENVTIDDPGGTLGEGGIVSLTNCILTGLTDINGGTVHSNYTVWLSSPASPVYQTVGAGCYYLTNGSPYRGAGTTNITPVLLTELADKTTWPPIVYSNTAIAAATTFSPQAQRDAGATLDYGYHYDALDYCFGGVTVYSNMTFTTGTAVGWFLCPSGPIYGITLRTNVIATFNGTATAPGVFARYDTVQEGGDGFWTRINDSGGILAGGVYGAGNAAGLTAVFTRFAELNNDGACLFRDGTSAQPLVVEAEHCEFYGNIGAGGYDLLAGYTNCLFWRSAVAVGTPYSYPYEISLNCTFYGGSLTYDHEESSGYGDGPPYWYSSIRDCAFDGTTFSIQSPFGSNTNDADYNFNAFDYGATQLPVEGADNVVVTSGFNWQGSWFGNYYLSTNSTLIQAGDRTADQIGLYHFTTQTNQAPETNSIVDIGYHYVATDTNGVPLDTNGDGIPDYLEDANGNGLVDSGEIGWNIFGDPGLSVIITQPRNGGILP